MTISEMVARNRRMYPNDTALIELKPSQGVRKEITWKEFDERVNRLANALIDRGIRKGDKVIHWMMNSISWLEAYFGIIRTGAWAVPLNFRFTSQDSKYCADIAEAKAIILGEEFIDRVEAVRPQLPTIKHYILAGQHLPKGMEDFEQVISNSSPQPVGVELRDEDECGLYFTSGTTGAPKPILLTHKNMECAAITENRHHYQTHKEYYKNPEKTAETIKNGWLYTGDMARQDDEGFIYIVDRKKDVVITGGENIYPVEIEDVLRQHPKVYDAAVIGIPDERLGEVALAVIDSKPGETLTEEEVNQFCEQNLPRYKRPRRIVFDRVPRNPTGKIEKPKLRQKYAHLGG